MGTITLYHNPRCSKSRAALSLLWERDADVRVVEYLKTPPSPQELARIVALLGVEPRALLRRNETPYRELGLADETMADAEILDAIAAHPILLQRPIAVSESRAVVGRPPERVLELL